jgi:ABC-type Fe3+-hydroxamate transport system substrate-binding protein
MGGVRRLGPPAVLLALALVLAGCGLKAEPTGADAAFPSSAVDAAGARVSLPAPPDRVVSLDAGASAVLRGIGLEAAVVDATPADVDALAADAATDLVVVPLALPDAAAARIAAATGAPVYRYGAAPLETAPTAITQLGLAVGRGPEAAAVARSVADGLAALAERIAAEAPVRTLVQGPGVVAYGPQTPLGQAVALAGGENVFTADAAWSPDDVVALDVAAWVSADPGGSSYAALAGIDELAAIPAIRDGRVITAPRDGYPVDAALPRALEDLADRLRAQPGAS